MRNSPLKLHSPKGRAVRKRKNRPPHFASPSASLLAVRPLCSVFFVATSVFGSPGTARPTSCHFCPMVLPFRGAAGKPHLLPSSPRLRGSA